MKAQQPEHKDFSDKTEIRSDYTAENEGMQYGIPVGTNNDEDDFIKDASAVSVIPLIQPLLEDYADRSDNCDCPDEEDSSGDKSVKSTAKEQNCNNGNSADNKTRKVHSGHRERLRKRMTELPLPKWEEHEALEVLLFGVFRRINTNEISHRLIEKFGSFQGVMNADESQLIKVKGISRATAQYIRFISRFAEFSNYNRRRRFSKFTSYDSFRDHVEDIVDDCDSESIVVLLLDAGKNLLGEYVIRGASPSCSRVSFRGIAEIIIKTKAVSIIALHTHPSGLAQPSHEDDVFTENLTIFLNSMDVSLFDHFIWSAGNIYSYDLSGRLDEIKRRIYGKYRR